MTTITVTGLDGIRARAGQHLGTSDWLEVTQQRVDTFADATGDHQWIHVDPVRAASGPFGGTIAHGFLTLSLVVPLFSQVMRIEGIAMGINYGLNRVRFPAPVPVGGRIRLDARLGKVTEVTGGVQALADFVVEIDGVEKPACVAQGVYRYYA